MMSLELIPETVMCSAVQRTRIQNRMPVYARKRLKLIPVPCLPAVSLKFKCDAISHVTILFLSAGWTEWSNWTKCSVECGATGLKSRTRSCSEAEIGSLWCRCGGSSPVTSCIGCLTSDWQTVNQSETSISEPFIIGYHDETNLGFVQVEKCDSCRKFYRD